jgi:hypothetical protein
MLSLMLSYGQEHARGEDIRGRGRQQEDGCDLGDSSRGGSTTGLSLLKESHLF